MPAAALPCGGRGGGAAVEPREERAASPGAACAQIRHLHLKVLCWEGPSRAVADPNESKALIQHKRVAMCCVCVCRAPLRCMQLKGSQVEGPVKDLETSERRCQAEEMPKGLIRWAAASRVMCGVLFVGTMDP